MGRIYSFYCKKCKYRLETSLGIGMMFPLVYKNIVEKSKNGELGEEIQKFFIDNPNGVVDVENVLGFCEECGEYETIKDLTMYVPKTNYEESAKDYVFYRDLKEHYKIFKEYRHKCKNCGSDLKIVLHEESDKHKRNIICPICKKYMIKKFFGYWD